MNKTMIFVIAVGVVLLFVRVVICIAKKGKQKKLKYQAEALIDEVANRKENMKKMPVLYREARVQLLNVCCRLTVSQKAVYGITRLLQSDKEEEINKYLQMLEKDIEKCRTVIGEDAGSYSLKEMKAIIVQAEASKERYLRTANQMEKNIYEMCNTANRIQKMLNQTFTDPVKIIWQAYMGNVLRAGIKGYALLDDVQILTIDGGYASFEELTGQKTGICLYPVEDRRGVKLVSDTEFSIDGDELVKNAVLLPGQYEVAAGEVNLTIEIG